MRTIFAALCVLSVGSAPAASAEAAGGYRPQIGFLDILLHTPTWVFGLLAALIVFGLMQARTRRVPVWLALLLPVAMMGLSLWGVLQYVGLWLPALAAWLLAVGVSTAILLRRMDPATARYDPGSGGLIIAGSWLPLLVILGIFVVRYALGVGRGMQLGIVDDAGLQIAVSLLLGAFSGFFLARGLMFWRTQSARSAA